MATNPYFTQYHTQRFSFIGSPQQRDGTFLKDQRFLNMYPELIKSPISDGKKYYLKKRPGVELLSQLPAGLAQGVFFWNGHIFSAIGGAIYIDNNTTPQLLLTQNTSPVGFVEFRTDAVDELFLCDGISGWTISTSLVFTKITDANFPNPHIPMPVYLDGYIFLAQTGTQTIRNSTLNDPTTWPSADFIDAEMFPDNIVGLSKVQNYLAVIGQMSIEWFYDNANATGSPLQRNAPAVSQFGCPAVGTINQTEKELILVGNTNNGGQTVWVVDGFQPTEIANEPVRMALDEEGTNINGAWAFTVQCAGHKWYILTLIASLRTFVYDFEEKMWHEWGEGTAASQFVFNWKYATNDGSGLPVLLQAGSGQVGHLDADVYTDVGSTIYCAVTTAKIDFDTIKRKRLYRLSLVADAPNGTNNTPINVSWSDDDYNTFSTPVTLQINGSYPTITQLGYTRRRAFKFEYTQNLPLRMESFEVDIIQEVRR